MVGGFGPIAITGICRGRWCNLAKSPRWFCVGFAVQCPQVINTFMQILKNIFPDENTKTLKKIWPIVETVNDHEQTIQSLSDEALAEKTNDFKTRLNGGETLDDILPEAFAVVREAARRLLGERHYDVQLVGGVALHQGTIAEMRTGEGKTLVATLPVYLNALTEKGVHVVTVNDYLARRDAVWMGQIYDFLGLSVGAIGQGGSFVYDKTAVPESQEDEADELRDELGSFKVEDEFLRPCEKFEAYAADITYGTNNEFGFDYLRDNLAYDATQLVQREPHYAIVDEIDSILVDEARTPLIISAPGQESESFYEQFSQITRDMEPDTHYTIDEKAKAITLTDAGIEKAENTLGVDNLYTEGGIKEIHHLETAVRAKALFERDKEYVIRDGQVVIVDEFTGRLQPGRRWSEGLHQAIEAKEGIAVQKESRTVASITFQNYFRGYEKLAGMTGTASTSSEEFMKVYGLDVIEIPTNRPVQRIDRNDLIYQTEEGKFRALAAKVKELNERGQPVLIGTVSVDKNELLSAFLEKEGVPHQLLNAKNHENEGEVIAQAGQKGSVVVATNLAGRGVDIKLGGNPSTKEATETVKNLGGLFVLGTERHEARRIDNQLRGRSGRQGDPGETQFFVSMEDSLMRVFAADTIKKMMGTFNIPEDQAIESKVISRSLESAQTKIEGFNFDSRKNVLKYDDVLASQREKIYGRRRDLLIGSIDHVEKHLHELVGGDDASQRLIERRQNELGREEFLEMARKLLLQLIDQLWMDHLEGMDYLRNSVRLRAIGQRDPLVEYKKEGLAMFHELEEQLRDETIRLLPNVGAGMAEQAQAQARKLRDSVVERGGDEESGDETGGPASNVAQAPRDETGNKIGRNDEVEITDGNETQSMKYKKAEPLIESGQWRLVKK